MREYVRFAKNKKVNEFIGECIDLLEIPLTSMFVIILLFAYVLQIATVQGSSMVPTLQNDDKLLVNTLWFQPEVGDIVIIDAQEATLIQEDLTLTAQEGLGKTIVKRVIAVGGQTLDIDFERGIVYVDDEPLAEDYTNSLTTSPMSGGAFDYPIEIPEGYLFVLGDNREVSKDSRYPDVGLIHVSDVVGEVLMRLHPWETFGLV